jgi:hypothetical protein
VITLDVIAKLADQFNQTHQAMARTAPPEMVLADLAERMAAVICGETDIVGKHEFLAVACASGLPLEVPPVPEQWSPVPRSAPTR